MKKVFVILTLCFFICCCARSSSTLKVPSARYYPKCAEPLAYVDRHPDDSSGSAVARGMMTGGALSGLATVLAGTLSGRLNVGNVLVGVGVGAAAGGMIGASQGGGGTRENNKKMAEYLEQIDGDIEDITTVSQAAATLSLQCYNKNFQTLLSDVRRKKISGENAIEHFSEIQAGVEAASGLLDKPSDMDAMEKEFDEALKGL